MMYRFVSININHHLIETRYSFLKNEEAKYENSQFLLESINCDCMTRLAALTIAYPLQIIMIRSMAQFIGRETYYDTIVNAIADIYQTGGLRGFYAGFLPLLCYEVTMVVVESSIVFFLRRQSEITDITSPSLILNIGNWLARALLYPFKIVSTVMSCNGRACRSLAASAYTAPEHKDWVACLQTLWNRGEIKRGSALFFRHYPATSPFIFPIQPLMPKSN
ncbi:hypothetical protein SSS_06844 [Sarcoptes scabiei]|nr:hypothetical protein SSS_06844 [Sarcoptes scabiei]